MLTYNSKLKKNARKLRKDATLTEKILWSRLRGKQILGIQFYRQKPIGQYIVDFYAPRIKTVIEIDGSQHFEDLNQIRDKNRDIYLMNLGLKVLRFNNLDVFNALGSVMLKIYDFIEGEIGVGKIPPR